MQLFSYMATITTNLHRLLVYTIFIPTFEWNWIDGISVMDFHLNDPTLILHKAPVVSTYTSPRPNCQELPHVAKRWSLRENCSDLYYDYYYYYYFKILNIFNIHEERGEIFLNLYYFLLPYNEQRMPSL